MATLSCVFAWEIPPAEGPDGLQSTGLQRVGHDLATEHNNKAFISEPTQMISEISPFYSPVFSIGMMLTVFTETFRNTG